MIRILTILTSLIIALSASIAVAEPPSPTHQKVTLEFHRAPLTQVVRFFADMTGRNFIVEKDLSGHHITVLAPAPVTRAEAWQAFVIALQMNRLTIVKQGKYHRIISTSHGPAEAPLKTDTDGAQTRILPIHHTTAQQLEPILARLIGPDARIVADPRSNSLIIIDSPEGARRIETIVRALDVPGARRDVHILQLQHADAEDVARLLEQITSQ
jgi:general secretion pathway protein D